MGAAAASVAVGERERERERAIYSVAFIGAADWRMEGRRKGTAWNDSNEGTDTD